MFKKVNHQHTIWQNMMEEFLSETLKNSYSYNINNTELYTNI